MGKSMKEQMQEKTERLATEPAQIQIYDKKTGQVVDRAEASPDSARSKAESMISGKSGYGFRIIKPID